MKSFNPFTKICCYLLFTGLSISLLAYLLGGWSDLEKVADNHYTLQTVDLEEFDTLSVDSSLNIVPSKDEKFHLTYYIDRQDNSSPIRYVANGKKLTIQPSRLITYNGLLEAAFSLRKREETSFYSATLEIPRGKSLKEIIGNISVGDVKLEDIQLETLQLSVDTGNVTFTDTTIQHCNLDVSVGDIQLKNLALQSSLQKENWIGTDVGKLTANNLFMTGRTHISTDIGEIAIQLHPKTNIAIHADSDLGEISNYADINNAKSENELFLQSGTGNITVR